MAVERDRWRPTAAEIQGWRDEMDRVNRQLAERGERQLRRDLRRRRRWGSRPWRTMGLMALTVLAACLAIVWGVNPYAAVGAIVLLSFLAGYSASED